MDDPIELGPVTLDDVEARRKRGREFFTVSEDEERANDEALERAYYEQLDAPGSAAEERHAARLAYYEDLAARTPGWTAARLAELDGYDSLFEDGVDDRAGIDPRVFGKEEPDNGFRRLPDGWRSRFE